MPTNPNKLTQLWQELKRRRVIKVIAMYAGAAYVLIELVNNVAEPLRLPVWTPTLVILLLVIGFPVAVIFSWIFDVTPEGVKKTESIEDVKEVDSHLVTPKGIFNVSNVIIVVLLVAVCILLYPRIFHPDRFKDLRNDQGMITVAVLPFNNLTGDSSLYFWQNGISELLINGLAQSDELLVKSSQVVQDILVGTKQVYSASLSPEIARRTASKISASTHITGNYIGAGNNVSIVLNLVNTENGDLIWTTRVDGDLETNYRLVIDRLSDTVRNYLEIKALEDKVDTDLSNAFPNSADAYRHYIDGLNAILNDNYDAAIESLEMAYEIDTTFTFAAFYLAFTYCFNGEFNEDLLHWTRRAYELKNNLPPEYRPWIEMWYAGFISEDIEDLRRNTNMMFEAAVHSRFLLLDLAVTYSGFLDDYTKALQAFEKLDALNQRWEDDWRYDRYYIEYTKTLLMADWPEEVGRIAEKGLKVNPENGWLELAKGAKSIMINDSAAIINKYKEKIRANAEKYNMGEPAAKHYIGVMYCWAKDTVSAVDYFRRAYEMDPERMNSLSLLIACQLENNLNLEECLRLADIRMGKLPDSAFSWYYKGICLFKLGRYEESLVCLREAQNKEIGFFVVVNRYISMAEQALALQVQQ